MSSILFTSRPLYSDNVTMYIHEVSTHVRVTMDYIPKEPDVHADCVRFIGVL